jgi:hypothetical protein
MFEYRAVWNVQGGGIGYSVFHVRKGVTPSEQTAAQGFADDLRAGFNSLVTLLPDDVLISFESEARELNTTTGQLIAVHSITAPASVAGTNTGTYSAPSGARVDLITGGIVAGRRLRGRTYVVPLIGTAYTNTGLISSTAQSTLETAFEMFRDETDLYSLGVWSRTHGVIADVTSVNVPNEAAILRSRRE